VLPPGARVVSNKMPNSPLAVQTFPPTSPSRPTIGDSVPVLTTMPLPRLAVHTLPATTRPRVPQSPMPCRLPSDVLATTRPPVEARVVCDIGGRRFAGQSVSTDVLEASAVAYVRAVNASLNAESGERVAAGGV